MATEPETEFQAQPASPRMNRKKSRKSTSKRVARISASAVVACACIGVVVADRAAAPRFSLSFSPSTNTVRAQLSPGFGPFAQIVFHFTSLVVHIDGGAMAQGANHGETAVGQIPSGKSTVIQASAAGPFLGLRHWQRTLTPPEQPKIESSTLSTTTDTLRFNIPLSSARVIAGLPGIAAESTETLTLRRPLSKTALAQVYLVAKDGERSTVSVKVPPVEAAPIVYFGASSGRRIYITMDDGWYRDSGVLALMKQYHVPITTFLIEDAAAQDPQFWRQFIAAGGTIEDHTVSHPALTKVSPKTAEQQWAGPMSVFSKWFQQTPTLGRPPYGDVNRTVQSAATAAGLHAIVMWSASMDSSNATKGLWTWNGGALKPGEIILLHWQPGAASELRQILSLCRNNNLVPAPLLSGLPTGDG